ncbi:hypothetical protein LZ757_05195 [Xylella fastidiosa subsp. morus]|uniref:Methyltransferase type 11 domain-containing protein n=1 Tax=Xylella fastidiosa subsp. multiplex TaxID=644357 RepID=A0A9Q4MGS3_XYLFS|nr:methyltransferase domain-containing protein [Xylella fastidiosa]AIC12536.1 hypothetical protein P303_05765 [Xylella fastidiosa MUL0034]EWG13600.1 hypothetical protein P910_003143 [Xylella fastidiosa Mul-MD]KFA40311.1 hypothetical protein DF22_003092 [Xylella fastidiosa]MBE0269286.1 hypothetical protein [Xylella fastidiosa subsp. multiplex]MBE0275961.1 hypothetical protein [Xylella fastidiosa subsp. multiplex]
MPAALPPCQTGLSSWFETGAGRLLIQFEYPFVFHVLRERSSQPWLWFSVSTEVPSTSALSGCGLHLIQCDGGFKGDVRCLLPLPLPTESVRVIVVQHVVSESVVEFFEECARVLIPGGSLYLFALNPLSPYCLRWLRQWPVVVGSERWCALLRNAGLHCRRPVRYLGPTWRLSGVPSDVIRAPWRAVCLLEADKRMVVPTGLIPARVGLRRPLLAF